MKWDCQKFNSANVRENDCYFHFVALEVEADKNKPEYKGPSTAEGIVPAGLYESNEFFIHTLNSLIKNEVGNQKKWQSKSQVLLQQNIKEGQSHGV